jgi:TonB family protein
MATMVVALIVVALGDAAPAQQPQPGGGPSAIVMDDDFSYQIVDYGLGSVAECAPAATTRRPRPVPSAYGDVFWVKLKLTNVSEHLLGRPRYLIHIRIRDNWGNTYERTDRCSISKSDRYKPHESTTEVVTVNAHEFVDHLRELRMSFDRERNVLSIGDPLARRRDLRREQAEPDRRELVVRVIPDDATHEATTAISTGETRPRLLREVRPQYTGEAMRAKIQGKVTLEVLVQADGSVDDVRIVKSLDPTFGLDLQAITAAKAWRFSPGTRGGEPVPMWTMIDMTFTLR